MTVKEILKDIYGIDEENALFESDLKYFDNRFGRLPNTLKEFYLICGNNPYVTVCQDCWLMPEHYKKWEWLQKSKDFIILNENQGVCRAFIKEEDFGKPNPPVYVRFDEDEPPKICANSVDEFVKAFLVYEGSLCMPYMNDSFYFINEDEFKFIKSNFKEYPFKIEYWIGDGSIRLFYNTSDCICVVGNYQMHYGARNKENFEQLENLLGSMGEPG